MKNTNELNWSNSNIQVFLIQIFFFYFFFFILKFLVTLNVNDLVVFLATHKPHLMINIVETLEKYPHEEYIYLEAVIDLAWVMYSIWP